MKALNVSVDVIGEMISLRKMSQVKGFSASFIWDEGGNNSRGVEFYGVLVVTQFSFKSRISHFQLSLDFSCERVYHFQPSKDIV